MWSDEMPLALIMEELLEWEKPRKPGGQETHDGEKDRKKPGGPAGKTETRCTSLPSRGAWIEISGVGAGVLSVPGRSPRGERG